MDRTQLDIAKDAANVAAQMTKAGGLAVTFMSVQMTSSNLLPVVVTFIPTDAEFDQILALVKQAAARKLASANSQLTALGVT